MKKWKVKYKHKTLEKFKTETEAVYYANFYLMCKWTVSPSEIKIIGKRDGKKVNYRGDEQ